MTFSKTNQPQRRRGKAKPKENKISLIDTLRKKLKRGEAEFFERIIDVALGNKDIKIDRQLALAILQRVEPPMKPETKIVNFEYNPQASLKTRVKQVSDAVCAGILPVDSGKDILAVLTTEAEIIAVLDKEERLKKVEAFQQKIQAQMKSGGVAKDEKVQPK